MDPRPPTPPTPVTIGRAALLACATLPVISGTALAPALPSIHRAFAPMPGIDWLVRLVVTMPALALALAAPGVGRLADRLGRRRVLLCCLVLYVASGASGLVLGELWEILVGRALLGVAAAGIMTASTAIAAASLAAPERTRFFARQASVMSLAGVASVAIGGVLGSEHWRAPFVIYVAAAPLAVIVRECVVEPSSRSDVAGPSLTDREQPTTSRSRVLVYGLTVIAMGFVFMVPLQVPFLLSGEGPRFAGLAVATSTFFAAASSLLFGRLQPRSPSTNTWIARSFTVIGAGYLLVGSVHEVAAIFAGLAIAGVGSGWIMPELSRSLVATTSERTRGASIGALTSCVYAGQFLSPTLPVLFGARRSLSSAFSLSGVALITLAVLLGIGARAVSQGRP